MQDFQVILGTGNFPGHYCRNLRSDSGGDWSNRTFASWLSLLKEEMGMSHVRSNAGGVTILGHCVLAVLHNDVSEVIERGMLHCGHASRLVHDEVLIEISHQSSVRESFVLVGYGGA